MIVDCCMYIYILVQFIDTTHVAFLLGMYVYSILYSSTISYILCDRTMKSVHHLIALFASLISLLLLPLIIIYDEVGMYNKMIMMDWGLVC